jgi:hypothetical protein
MSRGKGVSFRRRDLAHFIRIDDQFETSFFQLSSKWTFDRRISNVVDHTQEQICQELPEPQFRTMQRQWLPPLDPRVVNDTKDQSMQKFDLTGTEKNRFLPEKPGVVQQCHFIPLYNRFTDQWHRDDSEVQFHSRFSGKNASLDLSRN